MSTKGRMRVSELAALLGVSSVHAWRLGTSRLRARRTGGVLTVDAQAAVDLKRRRDQSPPNLHGGHPTWMQEFMNRNSEAASTAAETAEGPARRHRAARGTKTAGARRVPPCARRAPAAPGYDRI